MILGIDQFPVMTPLSVLNIRGIANTDDDSLSNHSVTNTGVIVTTPQNLGFDTMSFNGTSDHLSVLNNADLQLGVPAWAISLWVSSTSNGADQSLVRKYESTTDDREYSLAINADGTVSIVVSADGGNVNQQVVTGTTNIQGVGFVHVVVASSAGVVSLYIDGTSEGTPITNDVYSGPSDLYIGARSGGILPLNGSLQDVQISKGYNPFGTRDFPKPNRIM
jgi:hypothetical protein